MADIRTPSNGGQAAEIDRLLERLPELDALLHAASYAHGPDRWLNLQDLLVRMTAEGRRPRDAQALRRLLTPLFCRTPEEQTRFRELFERWRDPAAASTPRPAPPPDPAKGGAPSVPSYWVPLLGALLVAALLAVGVYIASQPQVLERGPQGGTPEDRAPTDTRRINGDDSKDPALKLPLQPIPPRQPLEPMALKPFHRGLLNAVEWAAIAIPLLLGASWLGWSWWRRRVVLRRGQQDAESAARPGVVGPSCAAA